MEANMLRVVIGRRGRSFSSSLVSSMSKMTRASRLDCTPTRPLGQAPDLGLANNEVRTFDPCERLINEVGCDDADGAWAEGSGYLIEGTYGALLIEEWRVGGFRLKHTVDDRSHRHIGQLGEPIS